jgi:hypothetical protein
VQNEIVEVEEALASEPEADKAEEPEEGKAEEPEVDAEPEHTAVAVGVSDESAEEHAADVPGVVVDHEVDHEEEPANGDE